MIGQSVELDNLEITYPNGFTAVHSTSFTVEAGEFFSVLGPSGCGKTTLLRAISGFQDPTKGRILIGGNDQQGIGPNRRPTALIFQNLALFPLMSVLDNVAFGLESRGVGKTQRHQKALELLELVELRSQADKRPTELSGGQKQRVAIARALAVEPALLLLDEPLSALDLKLRQHMRSELRSIQKRTGVTFIYITHDQSEALTMSDRIAVMNAGTIEQIAHGDEIYSQPASAFVASFVGESNCIAGRVTETGAIAMVDSDAGKLYAKPVDARTHESSASKAQSVMQTAPEKGDQVYLFIRPERVTVCTANAEPPLSYMAGSVNRLPAVVVSRDPEGPYVTINTELSASALAPLTFRVHMKTTESHAYQSGTPVELQFDAADTQMLPMGPLAETGESVVQNTTPAQQPAGTVAS